MITVGALGLAPLLLLPWLRTYEAAAAGKVLATPGKNLL
jgi:hypothetical protein